MPGRRLQVAIEARVAYEWKHWHFGRSDFRAVGCDYRTCCGLKYAAGCIVVLLTPERNRLQSIQLLCLPKAATLSTLVSLYMI